MKIALFEPSQIMREMIKSAVPSSLATFFDFADLGELERKTLQTQHFNAIVTAREFSKSSLQEIIHSARTSRFNQETPIFLFTSDLSLQGMDAAFDLGVTDIFFKQELAALADTLCKVSEYKNEVRGAKVLLVEDNKAISNYYCEVLKSINCQIFQARSCAEAAAVIENQHIELVITDLNLEEGGQGQRIIHKMRHNERVILNKVPIMVLSSIDTMQTQTGLFFLGIDDYLVKPVLPLQFSLRAINLIKKYRVFKQAELQAEALKRLAHHDKLTKVFNRNGFEEVAKFCIANSKRSEDSILGVMYIDLNDFKPVNDKYGHDIGDEVLCNIANKLKVVLREQDVIARWGGDEFVVLLNQCELIFMKAVCDRVATLMNEDTESNYGVSCSFGFAYGRPQDYNDLLKMIKNADRHMYQHKQLVKQKARAL